MTKEYDGEVAQFAASHASARDPFHLLWVDAPPTVARDVPDRTAPNQPHHFAFAHLEDECGLVGQQHEARGGAAKARDLLFSGGHLPMDARQGRFAQPLRPKPVR